ncbi:hypothetical protein D3C84_1107640 [compost metagenome]
MAASFIGSGMSRGSGGAPRRQRTIRRSTASTRIAMPNGLWIETSIRYAGVIVETMPTPMNSIARIQIAMPQ